MDMYALVPAMAPHLLSTLRLGYHHARPPRVTFQFCPHEGTSAQQLLGAKEKVYYIQLTCVCGCVCVFPPTNYSNY